MVFGALVFLSAFIGGESSGAVTTFLTGLVFIYLLAVIIPSFALTIRRLHDTGRSGWWVLIGFIPLIGPIALLIFYCEDSQYKENKWGPNPKLVKKNAINDPNIIDDFV